MIQTTPCPKNQTLNQITKVLTTQSKSAPGGIARTGLPQSILISGIQAAGFRLQLHPAGRILRFALSPSTVRWTHKLLPSTGLSWSCPGAGSRSRRKIQQASWLGREVALESRATFVCVWTFCPHGLSGFLTPQLVQLTGASGLPCSLLLPPCSVTSYHALYPSVYTFLDLSRHPTNRLLGEQSCLGLPFRSRLLLHFLKPTIPSNWALFHFRYDPPLPHLRALVYMIPSGPHYPHPLILPQSPGILSSL